MGGNILPVPEHRDAVAIVENLHHPVGNIDDRDALVHQLPHDVEQNLRFLFGQRGGRFVQDQDPAIEGERLGNLDQLLLGNRQAADQGGGIDIAKPAQHIGRLFCQPGVIHQRRAADIGCRHENVFSNADVRAQRDFLMHEADAQPLRDCGRGNSHHLSVEADFAAVGPQNAIDDVHQGRLAGSILAGNGMHFALAQLEPDIPQGLNGSERLAEIVNL